MEVQMQVKPRDKKTNFSIRVSKEKLKLVRKKIKAKNIKPVDAWEAMMEGFLCLK